MLRTCNILASSLIVLLFTGFYPSQLYAATEYISALQKLAIEKSLWRDPIWINLLHYDEVNKSNDEYISQVDDDRFFNAHDGKSNSKNELLETIASFFKTTEHQNNHPQCQFVARLAWLTEQLTIVKENLPNVDCKEYREWSEMVKAEKVTMVFPAYHLNSPSSMYGHTLLRLDRKFGANESKWLSYAVTFGAEINAGDNSIFYAFKGLAGGYTGKFIVTPYFKKIQEYNRIENRDIWEYPLNITPEETKRIMAHIWELKEINFDYFFFDENCSYRLLELLEVARPGIDLTSEFTLTAIPVDTVRAIENAGLIESSEYRPSQATILQILLDNMNEEEKYLVKQISNDLEALKQDSFLSLSEDKQHQIVDAAYKYIRYQQQEEARNPETAKLSFHLLKQLNSYPVNKELPDYEIPISPEKSHNSRRFSAGFGERLDKTYAELAFKFSYHDLEDNEQGFFRGAQINIGSAQFRINNDKASLHKLDLVDIFSITPRTQFFKPLSWRVYAGWERQPHGSDDVLVSHVTGGAGVSYGLWRNSQVYGLGILRLEHNNTLNDTVEPAIGLLTGLLHHFGPTTAHLEVSGEQFEDDVYRVRSVYKQNFVLATNHSLKFIASREWHSSIRFSEIGINYQYYFQ